MWKIAPAHPTSWSCSSVPRTSCPQPPSSSVRYEPLKERRARLETLLAGADADVLRFSEAFDDAEKLLAAALELGLEGIVSKKRDQPYRSGKNLGWVKVKTAAWREVSRDRWEMFR